MSTRYVTVRGMQVTMKITMMPMTMLGQMARAIPAMRTLQMPSARLFKNGQMQGAQEPKSEAYLFIR